MHSQSVCDFGKCKLGDDFSKAVTGLLLMLSVVRPDRQIAGEGAERKLAFSVKRSARFAIKALSPLDNSAVQLDFFYI